MRMWIETDRGLKSLMAAFCVGIFRFVFRCGLHRLERSYDLPALLNATANSQENLTQRTNRAENCIEHICLPLSTPHSTHIFSEGELLQIS